MTNKLLSVLAVLCLAGTAQGVVTINEVRADQSGVDNDEYFELAGPAGMSLAGLTYLVIGDGTGASGVVETVVDLSAFSISADGYFCAAETTFTLGGADTILAGANPLNFENTDNVTHMLVSGFSGANLMDLDTNDDGVLDLTPWSSMLDSIALVNGSMPPMANVEWWYGPTVGPDGTFHPGHAYRFPNGSGPWNIGLFNVVGGQDTPGRANTPAPGALALLGLGTLVAMRRRR
ncbi:hypothetical protein PHYC_00184 [Phycisphaerales bacterium]|nr:hypothetical protein PHYC_00184 [Phycisphaerales bacterium]